MLSVIKPRLDKHKSAGDNEVGQLPGRHRGADDGDDQQHDVACQCWAGNLIPEFKFPTKIYAALSRLIEAYRADHDTTGNADPATY